MNLDDVLPGFSASLREEARDRGVLSLGALLGALRELPQGSSLLGGISDPHSYRGYYERLAFTPAGEEQPVEDAIRVASIALGATFTGYKGGEFRMNEHSLVYLASYGYTGEEVTGIEQVSPGMFSLVSRKEPW